MSSTHNKCNKREDNDHKNNECDDNMNIDINTKQEDILLNIMNQQKESKERQKGIKLKFFQRVNKIVNITKIQSKE